MVKTLRKFQSCTFPTFMVPHRKAVQINCYFYFITLIYFFNWSITTLQWGFPDGSDSKESTCRTGDPGLIPGLGRSPGEGNGNPLPYSCCLENPTDRGAWWAAMLC